MNMSLSINTRDKSLPSMQALLDRFTVRWVKESDLVAIETLAQAHRFGIGLANQRLCFREAPDNWLLIEKKETGRIVSYSGQMLMGNGLLHGVKIFSDPAVRGIGITRLFETQLDTSGNATAANFAKFNSFAMVITFKLNVYAGVPIKRTLKSGDLKAVNGLTLSPITSSNVDGVLAYDHEILPDIDRSNFMREWICPKDFPTPVHAVAAFLNGSIVGYGCLRAGWLEQLSTAPITSNVIGHSTTEQAKSDWFLSPVYGESEGVAFSIINYLLTNHVQPGVEINFECLATNRLMLKIANELELDYKVCEYHRHPASLKYHVTRANISMDKVYAGILEWPL